MKQLVRAALLLSVLALGLAFPVAGQGSTLTIAGGVDIENTNVFSVTASPSFSVLDHIYEQLFEMTEAGELVPELAESITALSDNEYLITLKQGISFSDGTPFNAEAVKANLDYALNADNAAPYRFLLVVAGEPAQVEVVDEYSIKLTTAIPFAPVPAHLSHSAFGMVSPAALAQGPEFLASNAVGTGPYMLSEWNRAEQVVLTRNPNYWGEQPEIETLIFKVVPEAGARIVEIESGTVDVAVRIPPADIPRLQMNPDIDVVITPGLRTIYIFFNTTDPLFDDVRVRQAFNYAVDKEAIANSLFEGAARVSEAPFAPGIFGYTPQTPYPRDLDRARELLAEAGVAEGTSVVLYHPTGRYPQDALVADAVRSQLADIGINVELRTLEWPQYVPHVRRPKPENDIQFAMLGWSVPTMDADYALFALFHSSSHPPGFNGAFYSNPEVDRLLDLGRSTLDQAERQAAYAEAIEIIWQDAPWLFLYSEIQVTAIRSNVEGFIVHPDESLIATGASIN
ncbi:MAG: glutathione ABC transporter substrate-binding protein [Phototrophicales bacterium]|nr:MAG: glutathione ABC transporter substrate-binding protein [Phototrophicales bacterium]